jgi:hypothetical protein
MSVSNESRYNYSVVIRREGDDGRLVEPEHLGIRPPVSSRGSDDTEYQPSSGDNWSRIAWKKLGRGTRWWVIADLSATVDAFTDLRPAPVSVGFGQLSATLSAGANTVVTLDRAKGVKLGMVLTVEDMLSLNTVDAMVVSISGNVVTCASFTVPGGGIDAANSRVTASVERKRVLIVPSLQRTLLEVLDFNPLNTLED